MKIKDALLIVFVFVALFAVSWMVSLAQCPDQPLPSENQDYHRGQPHSVSSTWFKSDRPGSPWGRQLCVLRDEQGHVLDNLFIDGVKEGEDRCSEAVVDWISRHVDK